MEQRFASVLHKRKRWWLVQETMRDLLMVLKSIFKYVEGPGFYAPSWSTQLTDLIKLAQHGDLGAEEDVRLGGRGNVKRFCKEVKPLFFAMRRRFDAKLLVAVLRVFWEKKAIPKKKASDPQLLVNQRFHDSKATFPTA